MKGKRKTKSGNAAYENVQELKTKPKLNVQKRKAKLKKLKKICDVPKETNDHESKYGESDEEIEDRIEDKSHELQSKSSVLNAVLEKNAPDMNSRSKKLAKAKMIQRYEASQNISEFDLNEVGKEKVKLNELIKTSQKVSGQIVNKKQLQNAKNLKSLSLPLSKPQMEKIKRTIAYDKVCNEVAKWDPVVKSNRAADQIIFPLKKPEIYLESFETVAQSFVTKHPVEEAVSELLKTTNNILSQTKTLTPEEEKALQAMSLEEAKLRHRELMKHRALISYKEAKARRQNKIKSKRYHRILKREKLKKIMKEFEELQKTDASAALEKFLEADKLRILERMTLKHRNTGKWAKQQKIRAKYNPESRSVLKEDIAIGQQLREKVSIDESVIKLASKSASSLKYTEEPDMSSLHNRGLIEDVRKDSEDIETLFSFENEDHPFSKELNVPEDSSNSTDHHVAENESSQPQKIFKAKKTASQIKQPILQTKQARKRTVEDEINFSSEVTCLKSMVPDDITFGDEDLDDANEGTITINQAFADEEFIAEFREEKTAAAKANKPKGIDLYLPGWGSWGGPGIKPSKRKRQRFFIKTVTPVVKKDTLGNVIINEEKDKKAAEHQVSHLPFPFTNINQFESYIRQPVGHTWNPQSSFQNLTAPKVITKMGKIIEPIDPEDVILKKETKEIPVKKVKKGAHEKTPSAF